MVNDPNKSMYCSASIKTVSYTGYKKGSKVQLISVSIFQEVKITKLLHS